jgi:hypothetical protein
MSGTVVLLHGETRIFSGAAPQNAETGSGAALRNFGQITALRMNQAGAFVRKT